MPEEVADFILSVLPMWILDFFQPTSSRFVRIAWKPQVAAFLVNSTEVSQHLLFFNLLPFLIQASQKEQ